MDFTRFAIEKSRITVASLVVVLAAGVLAARSMPRAEDPGFIIRTALVQTMFPGAGPERVEQLVTDKLEKVIQQIPEIDYINSESKTGLSLIFVNFQAQYFDMQPIFDNLRRKVEAGAADLPDGVIGPFVNDEFGDVFGTIVTITAPDFEYAYLKDVAADVRDELLLVEEVAKVEIYGAQDERIFVEYNNARLAELGLSPIQLQQILTSRNIVMPGGEVDTGDEVIVLEPSGNFETVDQLRRTVINLPGSDDLILLEDVAQITRGYVDPPQTVLRTNGERGLALAISMRDGGNIIALGTDVRARMERLEAFYPIGIDFGFVQFQAREVQELIDGFVGNLVQAVLIVTVVMLFFLGLRTGLVVASLIPTAILMAFMVMGFLEIGMDQMSIAALIIALGLLVDNAIVVSESIMVSMSEGKSPVEAAVSSASELRVSLLTSSITTAAAFLPIYLAENTTGEYTAPLFMVVTITLLSSWVIAMTVIPLLCVWFVKVEPRSDDEGDPYDTGFYRAYRGVLLLALRRRWITLGLVGLAFAGTMSLFGLIPNIFFPPNTRRTMQVEVALPTGTPIDRTNELVAELDAFLADRVASGSEGEAGVVNWTSFIGQGAPRFMLSYNPEQTRADYAAMLVNTTDRPYVDVLGPEMEAFANARYPDVKITARPLDMGPPAWPPVEVRLSGRDSDTLFDTVEQLKERLASIPGTKTIDDDWGPRTKKLLVEIDQPRALRSGVSSQDIAVSLQAFLTGLDTTEFREDDKIIPVTLRSVAAQRDDIDRIESLNVYSQSTGQSVPLSQVADIRVAWEPGQVLRRDRLRTVTVESGLEPGYTAAEINAQLRPWLEEISAGWGPGYSFEFGGVTESSNDANAAIGAKLPIAGMLIVLLLVGQFNSFRRPAIILLTIPLGLIGVILALLASNLYFGFMTLLGIISLAGIVINNAIVLIDRIDYEIEVNKLTPAHAVIESAQRRLRPIVMTTFTTVGGLIPLYLGGGPMWEPMAMAIMGGLLFATVLTLGIVPVLYSLMFGVRFDDFDSASPEV